MRGSARRQAPVLLSLLIVGLCASWASAFQVRTTGSGAEIKWSSPSAAYFVNPSGGPEGALFAITASLTTWTDVSTSAFQFVYGGTTASTAGGSNNGTNIIVFKSLPTDSIGVTFTWYDTATGEIWDSDILLNTSYSWSADGAPGLMDVQNTVTHEAGHMLDLEDLYGPEDAQKTMYAFLSAGETKKRTLDPDDMAGISHLYPVSAGTITVASPNGGEIWEQGTSHDISWSSSGNVGSSVRIDLVRGGAVDGTIASSTENDGTFSWTVPSGQAPGTDYRVRVSSASDGSIADDSDGPFSIAAPPPPTVTLVGLAISGPASVNENDSGTYTATASWSDGSASTVTPAWSVSPTTYASIGPSGVLTTIAVPSDQSVTVSASYTSGGVTKTSSQPVTIVDVPATLTGLSVAGPSTVPETGSGTYAATASWSDGSASTVTPAWSVSPTTYASISASGALTTLAVPSDQSVTVAASYTSGGVTRTASQPVTIVDVPLTDSDGDGVPDTEEMGPQGTDAGYDGNADGVPDARQDNVASMHTFDGSRYVTLEAPGRLEDVRAIPIPAGGPADAAFPYGFFSFKVGGLQPGAPAAVTIFLDGAAPDTYFKYGATADDPAPHWYDFPYREQSRTGALFNGFEVMLRFVDGGRGDGDLSANGTVVDPGGPGISQNRAPPPTVELTGGGGGGGCAIAKGSGRREGGEIDGSCALMVLVILALAVRAETRRGASGNSGFRIREGPTGGRPPR